MLFLEVWANLSDIQVCRELKQQDLAELRELYRKAVELEGVASFSDPDARWGFKKKDEPFLGYKAHVACDQTGIITAVEVTPANEAELPQAKALVGELEAQGLKPKCLAADKAFDDPAFRAELAQEGIQAYIPCRQDLKRLARQGFAYDSKTGEVKCPAGKQTIGRSPTGREATFTTFRSVIVAVVPAKRPALRKPRPGSACT